MNALPSERRVAAFFALQQRVGRLRYRSSAQGRLPQRDEMLEREPGDPPLPVTGLLLVTIVVRRPKIFLQIGLFPPLFALSEALICKSRFNHLKRLAQLNINVSLSRWS
jgi:hypothetical protein